MDLVFFIPSSCSYCEVVNGCSEIDNHDSSNRTHAAPPLGLQISKYIIHCTAVAVIEIYPFHSFKPYTKV